MCVSTTQASGAAVLLVLLSKRRAEKRSAFRHHLWPVCARLTDYRSCPSVRFTSFGSEPFAGRLRFVAATLPAGRI